MGIFSLNRTSVGSMIEVQANESYVGVAGAYQAMADGYTNAYSVFENCIGLDMMEACVERGVMEATEFEVIQENFVTDMITKVRDFFKKLLEKIKGIVSTFIAKVKGSLCKDGKKLVDDYKKQVTTKDLSKFKYKWSEKAHDKDNYGEGNDIISGKLDNLISKCKDVAAKSATAKKGSTPDTEKISTGGGVNINKDDITENVILETSFAKVVGQSGTVTEKEFAKEYHDYMFNTESEEEGDKFFTSCVATLTGNRDITKSISDAERKDTRVCTDKIKELDKLQKEVLKYVADADKSKYATAANSILTTTLQLANQYSTFVTKCYACKMEAAKFEFAQARRVWVKAATYSPKTEAVLLAAVEEASDIQVESDFDAII